MILTDLSSPLPVAEASLEALGLLLSKTLPLVRAQGAHGKTASRKPKSKPIASLLRGAWGVPVPASETNSGRVERRICWQTDCVGWFEDIDEWPGPRSVIIESERSVRNAETGERETSTERRLYISSLGVDPERALEATRKHWGVESAHWILDVTFLEDHYRARTGHAAANRASVRRMAVSMTVPWARRHKCAVKEAMMFANQSREARLEMLS